MNIISFKDTFPIAPADIGNKAFALKELKDRSQNVVDGIVIPTQVFRDFLKSLDLDGKISGMVRGAVENRICVRRNLSYIRELIKSQRLEDDFIHEIRKALKENKISLEKGICVRSSSVNEDSVEKSFAGIYTSYISIDDELQLEKAILGVWASAFSEIVFLYAGEKSSLSDYGANIYDMAVLIQPMVYGDKYGVVFTQAPNCLGSICIEMSDQVTGVVDGKDVSKTVYIERNKVFDGMG